MFFIESALAAISLAISRASDMAMDPANALYTGGLLLLGIGVVVALKRGDAKPRSS